MRDAEREPSARGSKQELLRAPRSGARPGRQVRRPGAEEQGLAGGRVRPRAAGRGRADDRDHARRAGRRPRRHPGRRSCGACWSSRPAATASRRRWSTRRSSGSPTRSSSPRRAASACPRVAMDVERPLHARVSGLDVEGEPVDDRGLGPRGARPPARDRPPRRGPDPRPRPARPAQGARCGRCAKAAATAPPASEDEDEEERSLPSRAPHRRVRTAYLGTSEFAATVLRRLAGRRHRPALVVTPPDSRRGRGRQELPPPAAEAARELGIELAAGRERQRRARRWSGSAPPGPRRSSSAPSGS